MKDIKKEIADLKARIQELENQIADPVKWQPVGGNWWINITGSVKKGVTHKQTKEFGHERPTKEQAERAAVEMRRFNRLLALRDELCGDDGNWLAGRNNYWVYYDYEEDNYGFCSNSIMQTIGLVYFTTDESAQRACDMLNSGEVEL